MTTPNSTNAYAPREIAERVEKALVIKAGLEKLPTILLAVLAGAYIGFGAVLYAIVVTESGLGFGPERLLGGVAFSLGLILVLIGGAELFTGNSLIVFAWADGKITLLSLLRNWGLVYFGNFVGATLLVFAIYWSGVYAFDNGAVATTSIHIAEAKILASPREIFIRGILCNILVCLAVWLCFAAHSVSGKILAIMFPVSAFVALGFEHSVANMYIIPAGWLAGSTLITIEAYLSNLLWVTAGNIVGGGPIVAFVYWIIYRKSD